MLLFLMDKKTLCYNKKGDINGTQRNKKRIRKINSTIIFYWEVSLTYLVKRKI